MLLAYKKSTSFSLNPRPTVSFSSKGQVVAKSGTLYLLLEKLMSDLDIEEL